MKLLSINIGKIREIDYQDRRVTTGIYKEPIQGSVQLSVLGVEGDVQVDRENHGGPDKAVYAYTIENYQHWQQDLNRAPFSYGQFGENCTVTGLMDDIVHIGDIFRIGTATLQVTQPRVPCFKLGVKMGEKGFVGKFRCSGRVGFYLRVLEEGTLEAGTSITRWIEDPARLTVCEAMKALEPGYHQKALLYKLLEISALSQAWRQDLQKRLESDA